MFLEPIHVYFKNISKNVIEQKLKVQIWPKKFNIFFQTLVIFSQKKEYCKQKSIFIYIFFTLAKFCIEKNFVPNNLSLFMLVLN